MLVSELHAYLRSMIDLDSFRRSIDSVDRIIIGDPDMRITKVGVCWMPYLETIRSALQLGINTVVVHEPTVYQHREEPLPGVEDLQEEKWDFIRKSGLAIIRCHDALDAMPGWGVPYALGQALGFSSDDLVLARSRKYFKLYKLQRAASAIDVAKELRKKLQKYGQEYAYFAGNPDRIIDTVGVGTGFNCNWIEYRDVQAGLYLVTRDRMMLSWEGPVIARDSGQPLMEIDHGVSEEPGVIALHGHMSRCFPAVEFVHFPQGHAYLRSV